MPSLSPTVGIWSNQYAPPFTAITEHFCLPMEKEPEHRGRKAVSAQNCAAFAVAVNGPEES